MSAEDKIHPGQDQDLQSRQRSRGASFVEKKHSVVEPDDFNKNNKEVCESFDDMKLKDNLLRGIYTHGFERPSQIQQRGITPCTKGHDTIVQAQSGTGKTATFCIASLQRVNERDPYCQVLILAPTTLLAQQIHRVLSNLHDYMNIVSYLCVEGTKLGEDHRILEQEIQIVVGTPVPVGEIIERNALRLEKLKMFIMDEADELLSLRFKNQIDDLLQYLPSEVQFCLFSTTMPVEILNMTKRFTQNPVRILVKKEALTLDTIRQLFVCVEQEDYKLDRLCDL